MQFSKLAFLAAIASSVTAQTVSISDLPTCALAPAVTAIGTTGCGTDIVCVCKDTGFLAQLTPLIQADCSAADFAKAVSIAVQICAENGVTITPPTIGSSTSAPASSAPATSAPASTSAVTTTSAGSSAAVTPAVTTTTAPKNGTVSTSALPSVVTANAAAAHGTWAAAGLLGVGALLAAL